MAMDKTNPKTVEQKLFSAKPSAERLNEEIKEKILKIREKGLKKLKYGHSDEKEEISRQEYEKITELAEYIAKYVQDTGKEQAIIDFQTGLNLLNGYKKQSSIETQIRLEEDGDFGEKTLGALLGAMKYYPVSIIAQFIRLGAINNNIWQTKDLPEINTDEKIVEITSKFSERN